MKKVIVRLISVISALAMLVSAVMINTAAEDLPEAVPTVVTEEKTAVVEPAVENSNDGCDDCCDDESIEVVFTGKKDYELPFVPKETEHKWNNGVVTTQPTCTTPGVMTYTCLINSMHTKTEEIPATGHKPGQPVRENETQATCVSDGSYERVVYCGVCGAEISRTYVDVQMSFEYHEWGEWEEVTAPTETRPGLMVRSCIHHPECSQEKQIPPLGLTELSFIDDEVLVTVPDDVIPDDAEFEVEKIAPPPAEAVDKVHQQISESATVLYYYEVRLYDQYNGPIYHLDGEITIKTKIPQPYVGMASIKVAQEDENGNLIEMNSWWEDDYLCYSTDWLEIYD